MYTNFTVVLINSVAGKALVTYSFVVKFNFSFISFLPTCKWIEIKLFDV